MSPCGGIAPVWAKPVPRDTSFFVVSSVAYRHSWAAYQCPDRIAIIPRRARAVLDSSPFSALVPQAAPGTHRPWPADRKPRVSASYPPVIHRKPTPRSGGMKSRGRRPFSLIRRTTLPFSHLAGWVHTRGRKSGRGTGIAAMPCYVTADGPAAFALLRELIRPSPVVDFSAVPVKISCLHPISSPRWLIFFQHAHFARWHRENMNKHPKWPFAAVREGHKLPQSEVNSRHNNDP